MPQVVEQGSDANVGTLLEAHRAALQVHCYRMTGSLRDAEDLTQETFLHAWRSYESFRGTSSLRSWLYRIATNVCLDELKKRRSRRRLRPDGPAADPESPVGPPAPEALWLEPYPDAELPSAGATPEEVAVRREHISLAFLAALQLLPARQRAILILIDALALPTAEVAELLNTSVPAVDSAVHRARTALQKNRSSKPEDRAAASPADAATRTLLRRFVEAFEQNDLQALVALLREDVVLSMPPFPAWYQGRDSVATILSLHPLGERRRAGWRLLPSRANRQPAFALYRADRPGEAFNAFGIMVLTIEGSRNAASVGALTIFKNTDLLVRFGFPLILQLPADPKTSSVGSAVQP